MRSLYLHVPFCAHKCHYCDFYSIVDAGDRQEEFAGRLLEELAALAPHARGEPLRTIFVGGGTPSLLRVDLWRRVLSGLGELFDLSGMGRQENAGEWTVECNPESATPELLETLAAAGVNRISLGAQSFDPRHLKTLERWHDPDNVERAVEAARTAGIRRVSIDLIFAIPGQTMSDLARDFDRALALGLDHLSCYSLTYEPNTAMTRRLELGQFERLDDDLEADMYEMVVSALAGAGLARYEVSNFAAPGHQSRHNLAYWRHEQWLAAGPSASGHLWTSGDWSDGSVRWKNVPRLGDYLAHGRGGRPPAVDFEAPDPARAVRERIMMATRTAEGIDADELLRGAGRIHPEMPERLSAAAARLADEGMLSIHACHPARWSPTARGFMLANTVARRLGEAAGSLLI